MKAFMFIFLLLIVPVLCFAQTPTLYRIPAVQEATAGSEFDVTIYLRDLAGGTPEAVMRSFTVTLRYDTSILDVVSMTEGSFMSSFGNTFVWTDADDAAGTAQFDCALLSTPFAYGSNDLFTIRFSASANGTVYFTYDSEPELRDGTNYPIIFNKDAQLYIQPDYTALSGGGEQCTLSAMIESGYNIRGIKIILQFDPTLVKVVSISNGTFMRKSGYSTFRFTDIRSDELEYNESILSPADVGESGDGTLFSVTFESLTGVTGLCPVTFKTVGDQYQITRLTDPVNQILGYSHEDGEIEIGPIGIDLYSLSATRHAEHVLVEWSTAGETNTAGFFVHRAQPDGTYQRLHGAVIPARGHAHQGAHYEFTDVDNVAENVTYKLEEICNDGTSHFYGPVAVQGLSQVNDTTQPKDYCMVSNYPNPFNPATTIQYHLPAASHVLLTIADAQGHLIKTVQHGFQDVGFYETMWYGTNENSEPVASGLYIYTLKTENFTAHGKMLLIK
ncbi:T9SS type A sorting domain-containing protein [candidate division KSB1 bacterium]|nr:T9SS type A sorting domain-containing protein [candidate division KSB1 bacterium]